MSLIEIDLRTSKAQEVGVAGGRDLPVDQMAWRPELTAFNAELVSTYAEAHCSDPSHGRHGWTAEMAYRILEDDGVPGWTLAELDALQHAFGEHPEVTDARVFELTWEELLAPADAEVTPLRAPHVPWPKRAAKATAQFGIDVWNALVNLFRPSSW
jgi:hypothetical protein